MNSKPLRPKTPANGSRLVRSLAALGVSDTEVSHKHFALRLGQLIDLSDSIRISGAHASRLEATFEPGADSFEELKEEFLQVRHAMVTSIIESFGSNTGVSRVRFPRPTLQAPVDSSSGYLPYGNFYTAHQRDMDFKIGQLSTRVREAAASASADLAQLATLDGVLADTLAVHSRKAFARMAGLLGKRFDQLLSDYRQAEEAPQRSTGTWPELLEIFSREMRELLLAEVEARLLPTQGLIEALNSEIDKKSYE